ncbi:acyltransferase [Nocardioides campestrisoli]|uniref:acyltransferase n=1 Tax=Nocardioides campestrisoli TaxID=2736757 RepID=UPI0037CB47AB
MARCLTLFDREVLRHLPPRIGLKLRLATLRRLGAIIGTGVQLGSGVRILHPPGLVLEDGASVARDVTLDARGGLTLKRDCLIGFESILLTSTHNSAEVGIPIQAQGMYLAPVLIEERAWLGARTVMLPGTTAGTDSVVGTASVVTRDVPCEAIVVGIPAKVLRQRT